MNKRKLASALLAGALLFISTLPASAADVADVPTPEQVFYREEPGQTFAGKINMEEKEVTEVEAGHPAFSLSAQDGAVLFDSLYTSTRRTVKAITTEGAFSQRVNLAVYDTLDVLPATGSAVLTVKDARTLKPIPGAKYALYCDGHIVKSSVESNEKGIVSLDSLASGAYELRQTSAPKGYQPASSVKFTVTGLAISGGDKEIRTSEGKKITAGENEVLIAGPFSPDIELTAENEKQIAGITVTHENFGASLGKAGTEKSFDYVTLRAAQEEINHLKDEGEICGAVHISYSLKEPACTLQKKYPPKSRQAWRKISPLLAPMLQLI